MGSKLTSLLPVVKTVDDDLFADSVNFVGFSHSSNSVRYGEACDFNCLTSLLDVCIVVSSV